MISFHHIPSQPLRQFAKLFWYYSGFVQSHPKERLLPDGAMSLVVNLREDHGRLFDPSNHHKARVIRGHVISGARAEYFVIDTQNMVDTIGVHFHPGGAFPFFKMPAGELTGQSLSLDQLWGSDGSDLRVRLLHAPTPQQKFQVLERWLMERLAKPLERDPVVSYALRSFQSSTAMPVSSVVDRIGMSQRSFIGRFTAEVGLTPKVFSRVLRFQRALHGIAAQDAIDWAHLALDCGYYDQAHFIHDFQAFSGITPATYVASGPRYLNHVPLYD